MLRGTLLGCLFACLATAQAWAGCGEDTAPCTIAEGSYHVLLPKTAPQDGAQVPAILFLHGYGGSGEGSLTIGAMTGAFLGRGYAVIAPDGLLRPQGRGRSWAVIPGRASARDDAAFVIAVADDAARRFGLDRDRMLLAGFSLGGSMASYVACEHPGAFAAYAPIAGSFWKPLPEDCAGPVRLFHTHGRADGTVPLAGREIRPGIAQGDVFKSLAILGRTDGCAPDAVALKARGRFDRAHWTGCTGGASLDLALHPGGHGIPPGWAEMVIQWLEPGPAKGAAAVIR